MTKAEKTRLRNLTKKSWVEDLKGGELRLLKRLVSKKTTEQTEKSGARKNQRRD